MTSRPVKYLAIAIVASAAVSACGLKEGVKDKLAQGTVPGAVDPGATGGTTGLTTGGATSGTTGVTTGVTTGGATGGTATGGTTGGATGGTTGGATSGTTGGTSGGATGGTTGGGSGTRTGIDDKNKVIHIAVHGPLTGAGVPQESFKTGGPKYWNGRKLSNGYSVTVEAIDDKYNAADALRACNAAEKENFLMLGGAGTDQISACAQSPVLRRNNMPYFSAGVTEVGLGNIPSYFATSLSYKEQAPLLIRLAKDKGYFGKKWAVVITSTPNFADARDAIVNQLISNGAKGSSGAFDKDRDVILTDKAPQNCSSEGTRLRQGGYEIIYFLGQPSFFAQCVGVVGSLPVNPIYTGPGPSFGVNSVISLACGANSQYTGYYLHPSPSRNQRAKYGAPDNIIDDIEMGIWGGMQQLHQGFELVLKLGGTLTREKFIAATATASLPGGVFRPASFTPQDHFGGTGAYANEAVCQTPTTNSYSNTIGVYNK